MGNRQKWESHHSDPFFDTVLLLSVSQYRQEQNKRKAAIAAEAKSDIPIIFNEYGTFRNN